MRKGARKWHMYVTETLLHKIEFMASGNAAAIERARREMKDLKTIIENDRDCGRLSLDQITSDHGDHGETHIYKLPNQGGE